MQNDSVAGVMRRGSARCGWQIAQMGGVGRDLDVAPAGGLAACVYTIPTFSVEAFLFGEAKLV